MSRRVAGAVPVVVWVALVALLVLAAATPGHFGDPAAPYRLAVYPLLAAALPLGWRLSRTTRPVPLVATTLVMVPFLVDTVGNVLDLYAEISWWDDLNHVTNWFLLCTGLGLAFARQVRPAWGIVVLVSGLGALLAIAWELGELATFYTDAGATDGRRLYEDTLADQALGMLGAGAAAVLVFLTRSRKGGTVEADAPDHRHAPP